MGMPLLHKICRKILRFWLKWISTWFYSLFRIIFIIFRHFSALVPRPVALLPISELRPIPDLVGSEPRIGSKSLWSRDWTCDRSQVTATETRSTETDTRRWSQGLLVLRPILRPISVGCDRPQVLAIGTNSRMSKRNRGCNRSCDRSQIAWDRYQEGSDRSQVGQSLKKIRQRWSSSYGKMTMELEIYEEWS